MGTYFMFGKYSPEAIKGISGKRTEEAVNLIKRLGGKVKDVYAMLGAYDLAFIVKFPGTEEAMKASLALSRMTGIAFSTASALKVEDFDKIATGL
ncbi:MAG TPA: GYD domain-containing protein [bacterium]|nr:GYD domain-containing protein [bacterium]